MKKENSEIVCPECGGSGKFFFFFDCPICLGKKKGKKEEIEKAKRLFNELLIAFDQQQKLKFFHFY